MAGKTGTLLCAMWLAVVGCDGAEGADAGPAAVLGPAAADVGVGITPESLGTNPYFEVVVGR